MRCGFDFFSAIICWMGLITGARLWREGKLLSTNMIVQETHGVYNYLEMSSTDTSFEQILNIYIFFLFHVIGFCLFQGGSLEPLDIKPKKCSEAPYPNSTKCSCQDCEAVCPPRPPPIIPPGRCRVLDMDCYDLAFGVVFAVFAVVFGCYVLCYNIVVQDSLRIEVPGEEHKAGSFFKWPGEKKYI